MPASKIATSTRKTVLSTSKILTVLIVLYIAAFGGFVTSHDVELYTGASRTTYGVAFLTLPSSPANQADFTQWAIKHMREPSKQRWAGVTSSTRSLLLGHSIGCGPFPYVVPLIFNSNFSDDEKVQLLHEYHADLNASSDQLDIYNQVCQPWRVRLDPDYASSNGLASNGNPVPKSIPPTTNELPPKSEDNIS